jgi:radical SAM protein with 4Fe4S-binding SPASM domain
MKSQLSLLERGPLSYSSRIAANCFFRNCPYCHHTPIERVFLEARGKSHSQCLYCFTTYKAAKILLTKIIGLKKEKFHDFATNELYTRSVVAWLRGIAKFGVSHPQPTFPPIAIVWNYTHKCNLNCAHCYQDSYTSGNGDESAELSTSDALRVVDHIAAAGVASLSFSGGEPLCRKDFFEVAKRTSQRNLLCTLSTNGTMIDHSIAEDLAAIGVTGVAISLDSVNSSFHDEFRGMKGAHAKAIRGIESCVEIAKFKEIIVAATLTNRNYKDIPGLIDLASEIGASRIYISRILSVGRGKSLSPLNVTPNQQKEILKYLAEEFVNYANTGKRIAVMTRGMTYFARQCAIISNYEVFPISEIVVGFEKRHKEILGDSAQALFKQFAAYAGGCATGLTYCGLSPEGEVLPCAPASNVFLGNILTEGLENIWKNNPIIQAVRNRSEIVGKCGKCKHNLICGGCRVTAYGETGNWLASDPSCPY